MARQRIELFNYKRRMSKLYLSIILYCQLVEFSLFGYPLLTVSERIILASHGQSFIGNFSNRLVQSSENCTGRPIIILIS